MPDFVKSAAFWQAVVVIAAALINYFLPNYALTADALAAVVFGLLHLFHIDPELRARGIRAKG